MHDIKDYYVIGDLHTAALVSRYGSIDWLCLPDFDSPSAFAAMLDPEGGHFSIDREEFTHTCHYVPGTAIVHFEFESTDFVFAQDDFMVPRPTALCHTHLLVRQITGRRGSGTVRFLFAPRPGYGKTKLDGIVRKKFIEISVGEEKLYLHLPEGARVTEQNGTYTIEVDLAEGEIKSLIQEYITDGVPCAFIESELFAQTERFWRTWVAQGEFFDFCRDELVRSAITLKLMQFYPTGAIVAAPTTSLPECIGAGRNWDYRYVWMRDATFTLYALYVLGYTEEAMRFFEFIESIAKDCEECEVDLELMTTIWGKPVPEEAILNHFAGYKNSKPVRIGNAAKEQFQLDIYGSLIDSHYFAWRRGVRLSEATKQITINLAERIRERWQMPDNGIWEIRTEPKHYAYSKVMAWVGINRVLRMKDALELSPRQVELYRALEREITDRVWQNAYDARRGILRQHPGTPHQDATNFMLVLLQFLNRHDKRARRIIRETARELVYQDIFVYRYKSDDGLQGEEGAFLIATFWYISALAAVGDAKDALRLFQRFEEYMNDAGLISEEINPDTKEYLGNYPQAFSHIGFIMAAYYIKRYNNHRKKAAGLAKRLMRGLRRL